MASFQKRGKTWQYTVSRMVNGKYKPIREGGFATKKEARVAAADVETNLRKGIVPNLKPIPLYEYFEEWYKVFKSDIANSTRTHYEYTLKIIKNYFNDKPIQDIRKKEYQEFLNWYGSDHAKETVEKVNAHIRGCVHEAIDESIINVDFTRKAKVTGNVQAKPSNEKHLGFEESEMLLKELRNRLDRGLGYYLLLLGLSSGLRYGELVGLTRKDFDFQNNTINVDKTWGYLNKMHEGFGTTKNVQSIRKIKIDPKTMNVFEKLFGETPTNIHQLVFFSQSSKYSVISNNNANKLLKNVLKDLGIKKPITVHGLRHTHASVLLYKRVSILYVSERLGHGDIDTTYRDYSHVIKELREEDENNTTKIFENMSLINV
ncbi:tyrosine-type recombinase/integrase [Alkalibacillus silvisoli]|uniref:Tyrosine-type recombinase/integrase n=1 Tax=Alkalibacillus silvisoli TaxID=392823 RepID=A0ABN1AAJ3_9BACI